MSYCQQCGRPKGLTQTLCPDCLREDASASADSPLETDAPLGAGDGANEQLAIARFQNGAEAGYFADELTREANVATEVLARERFDAVHAAWSVDYILLVPRPHAERAAGALKTLVEATGGDDGEESSSLATGSELSAGVWVPLILTLAAGSIACFGIERLDQRPRPPALVVGDRRKPPELWEVMAAARGTWVQQLDGGRGMRQLTLDPDRRSALLKEDHDGDGRFDREWEFSWKQR